MSQKTAKLAIEALGGKLRVNRDWNEYIVVMGYAKYHTDDLRDAVETAKEMANGEVR